MHGSLHIDEVFMSLMKYVPYQAMIEFHYKVMISDKCSQIIATPNDEMKHMFCGRCYLFLQVI